MRKVTKAKVNAFVVCQDHQGRTCLRLKDELQTTSFIPMGISNGFQVETTSTESFTQRFQPLPDYPILRACQLYFQYCRRVGATKEVLSHLGTMIEISEADHLEIITKRDGIKEKSSAAKNTGTPKVKKSAKVPVATTERKRPVSKSGKYPSASAMYQALLIEGKLDDKALFAEVQKDFGLPDKSSTHVAWYRNKLKRAGKLK
jgi:hypothetical protein